MGHGGPTPFPIIVGVGRSGTTLLRLMLDAHPAMAIPGETGFLLPLLDHPGSLTRLQFATVVTGFHTWPDLNTSATQFARELDDVEPFSVADGVRQFYRGYARQRGKGRSGDKTPVYGLQLAKIERLLPEAHFVHLIRDGRDVALSVLATWFAPGDDIGKLADHWCTQVSDIRRAGETAGHYLEVRYEDLVRDPSGVLQRICTFVDLPYSAAMLTYHDTARQRLLELQDRVLPDGVTLITQARRLRNHRLTSQPPEPSRIERWRREMAIDDQRVFVARAGQLLRELGYAVEVVP